LHHSHFRHTLPWIADDLRRSIEAIEAAGLPAPRWFRPPYGHVSAGTVVCARARRLPIVLWSAMGKEWVEPSADRVAARVERSLTEGAVVLLHDSEINPGSANRVVESLSSIHAALSVRGWLAVPLGELLSSQ
jgi:peptidoglycan/xylan/chitin deacetylase (PgdA/CDA1 family)